MKRADCEGAIQYALVRLKQELSPELFYHNLWHTRNEVMPTVAGLAILAGLGPNDTLLLWVAAAYHDLGFIERVQNHELAGMKIAQQTLPQYGFTSIQIDDICGMIMATHLPQSPQNLREAILADADLDVLGRQDFFKRNDRYRLELALHGQTSADAEWYQDQLQFLQGHTYFTPFATRLREVGKLENIAKIKLRLKDRSLDNVDIYRAPWSKTAKP